MFFWFLFLCLVCQILWARDLSLVHRLNGTGWMCPHYDALGPGSPLHPLWCSFIPKVFIIICYVWFFFSTGCLNVCELCDTAHLRTHLPGMQYECLQVLVPGLLAQQPRAALQGKAAALRGLGYVSCWEQSQHWAIAEHQPKDWCVAEDKAASESMLAIGLTSKPVLELASCCLFVY